MQKAGPKARLADACEVAGPVAQPRPLIIWLT